jgi:hypothetical protein
MEYIAAATDDMRRNGCRRRLQRRHRASLSRSMDAIANGYVRINSSRMTRGGASAGWDMAGRATPARLASPAYGRNKQAMGGMPYLFIAVYSCQPTMVA